MQIDHMPLQLRIILLAVLITCVSTLTVGTVAVVTVRREVQKKTERMVLTLARSFALIPEVRANLGKPFGELVIQPLAEKLRLASGAEFIVAFDTNGIRYSHPVPERIGQHFVGGDEERAIRGEEYTSIARGTLGESVRGFVPVYDLEGHQVGGVAAGFLVSDVKKEISTVASRLYLALCASLAVGIIGSVLMAKSIKKILFNLEPWEISTLLEQRNAILSSVREGIIAVDASGRIVLMNETAKKLVGVSDDPTGRQIEDLVPNTRLPQVLASGIPEFDQEQHLQHAVVVTNRLPMKVKGRVVGAVASFRNKSEVTFLAEQLTGVKKYIEALRAQSHEFRNKLHVLAGLIQLGKLDEALSLIFTTYQSQDSAIAPIYRYINPPAVAAVLIGKAGMATERRVTFSIDSSSQLKKLPEHISEYDIVTVVGNLIDNAIEAASLNSGRVEVLINQDSRGITMYVSDTGPGIPESHREKIWEHGFTTKPGGQGIGLTLVRKVVEQYRGTVSYFREDGKTVFEVFIPEEDRA